MFPFTNQNNAQKGKQNNDKFNIPAIMIISGALHYDSNLHEVKRINAPILLQSILTEAQLLSNQIYHCAKDGNEVFFTTMHYIPVANH